MSTSAKPKHIGRNISRIRELRGMKQEALAIAIGVSQQYVSNIEGSETVDEERLQTIAEVLGVSTEIIKNFSDEAVFNIIGNTVNNHDNASSFNTGCKFEFNPLDKILELYERLLQAEKDKVEYLEKIIKGK